MIGITISGKAYAAIAIAPMLPAGYFPEQEITSDREYKIWLPRTVVERLMALREPGESFSDVILRLKERESFATMIESGLGATG